MPGEIEGIRPGGFRGSLKKRFAIERRSVVALILGAVTVTGFAPFYLYVVPLVTVAVLVHLWDRAQSPRRAAALGWWFGFGCFVAGVSWVYVSLHDFGAMPAPLAGLFTLLFCAFLAVFPALTGYACAVLRGPPWLKLALFVPAV